MNISANIIAIKNIRESSATFIHDYLLSIVGQTLLERNVSGQVQQKVTTQDIADILIPIGCNELHLSSIIRMGYNSYKDKCSKVENILSGMSDYLFDTLRLEGINYEERNCCAVTLSNVVEDGTFNVGYYHPERMAAINSLKSADANTENKLKTVVIIDPKKVNTSKVGVGCKVSVTNVKTNANMLIINEQTYAVVCKRK